MKRLLCFGDSNTFCYDPRSYFGGQYPPDVRWTGLLQGMGWEVANCGQNGLCIPREPQFPTVAALLRRMRPLDIVTVMLGSNDLLSGASAEETAARMEALLGCLVENTGDASVLLIAPPPMRFGDWVQSQSLIEGSARLGALYRALAEKRSIAFADADEWGVGLAYDGVHFSPEGHAAFARGLDRKLKEIL